MHYKPDCISDIVASFVTCLRLSVKESGAKGCKCREHEATIEEFEEHQAAVSKLWRAQATCPLVGSAATPRPYLERREGAAAAGRRCLA